MGRPILGASKSFYVLVDSLIAGVRKNTGKYFKGFYFNNIQHAKQGTQGGNRL